MGSPDPPEGRRRPSPTVLRRAGLADAFGAISVLSGGLGATLGVVCCTGPIHDRDVMLVQLALVCAALWAGAFGLVSRGSTEGRNAALLGLILGLFAVSEGMFGLMLNTMR